MEKCEIKTESFHRDAEVQAGRQAGGRAEARLKYYLLAFIQLECERVTAAVNVQRAAAFRKKIEYKKRVTTVCQRRWQGWLDTSALSPWQTLIKGNSN